MPEVSLAGQQETAAAVATTAATGGQEDDVLQDLAHNPPHLHRLPAARRGNVLVRKYF